MDTMKEYISRLKAASDNANKRKAKWFPPVKKEKSLGLSKEQIESLFNKEENEDLPWWFY